MCVCERGRCGGGGGGVSFEGKQSKRANKFGSVGG